jgi:hypothetical protein
MVEAAVILPVLLVFFGVMALAHSAGKAKLAAQQDARASLMYYASNDCAKRLATDESSAAGEGGSGLPGSDTARNDALADEAAGGSFEARSSWSMAEGSAQRSAKTYGRMHSAKSTSWAVCNESANDGNLTGLAGYAFDLFGSKIPDPVRRAGR